MYKWIFKHFLSGMDPEKAHSRTCKMLSLVQEFKVATNIMSKGIPQDKRLNVTMYDRVFPNPLGMAAGFDKLGALSPSLHALGFGFVEAGSVTLHPRNGNLKPRIWREGENCLRNNMGLPNSGCQKVVKNLKMFKTGIVGISVSPIGKDNLMEEERINLMYNILKDDADYFAINVSCPNVKHIENIESILSTTAIIKHRGDYSNLHVPPVFVKLGPMSQENLKTIVRIGMECDIDGFITTNTMPDSRSGGLSGPCLKKYGLAAVRNIFKYTNGDIPIIGVGGISNYEDVLEYIRSGAKFVQLYTAFVYEGPRLPRQILNDLLKDSDKNGWESIEDLVGEDV